MILFLLKNQPIIFKYKTEKDNSQVVTKATTKEEPQIENSKKPNENEEPSSKPSLDSSLSNQLAELKRKHLNPVFEICSEEELQVSFIYFLLICLLESRLNKK